MAEVVRDSIVERDHTERPLTVIDLGCGDSPYRSLFAPYDASYLGADIKSNAAANVILDEETGTVDLPDHSADIVISTQVLEHVRSPRDYLAEARRLCRPDGLMILSTHGMFKYHPHPSDYRRWTAEGLRTELAEAGWRTERTIGVLGFAAAAFHLLQDAVVMKLPRIRPLRSTVAVMMQQMVGLLDTFYTDDERRENAAVYVIVATPMVGKSSCHRDAA